LRKWLLQPDLEAPIIDRAQVVELRLHAHAKRMALSPAANGGGRILRQHRLAVVEVQILSQGEAPDQSVV
jgi:hypothetical protein